MSVGVMDLFDKGDHRCVDSWRNWKKVTADRLIRQLFAELNPLKRELRLYIINDNVIRRNLQMVLFRE